MEEAEKTMSPQETHSNPAPPIAPIVSAPRFDCSACGTHNSADSKFCRQCGHLLRALPGNDARKAASAAPEAENDGERTSPAEIDARRARQLIDRALLLSERGDLNAALLACRQAVALDGKTAEPYALLATLLERSGDMNGAVKAYERVLEIAPGSSLERDSLERLKARLEKAPAFNFNSDELFGPDDDLPSLAPPSADEVVSFDAPPERDEHGIEARLPPTSASLRSAPNASVPVPVASAPVVATPVVADVATAAPVVSAEAPMVFEFDPTPADTLPSLSPLATALDGETIARVGTTNAPLATPVSAPKAEASSGAPKIERRVAQRRQVNVPVSVEHRTQSERRVQTTRQGATFSPSVWPATAQGQNLRSAVPAPLPVRPGLGNSGVSVVPTTALPHDFSFDAGAPVKAPLWAQMMRGSSFFARTLPLVAIGVLGLGFLSWARSQAVAGYTANSTATPTQVVPGTTTIVQTAPQQQGGTATGSVTAPATTGGGGVPITNATPAPGALGASASNNPAPASGSNSSRVASNSTGGARSAPVRSNAGSPTFPVPVAPAPVPPAPARSSDNGSTLVLPPPQAPNTGNASPPIQVGSLGGTPLNPGGSPQEGRIRITQGSLGGGRTAPPRSGTAARGEERAATAAAANGNQDRAITNLTNAINATGSDQGFLLQQRAMAFLDRGDSARAVEDFNASISAYQDQINRGENVASARAGINSARAGLNQALSRR